MSSRTVWKLVALIAALVAAVSWLIAGHQAAEAGHTIGNSHCASITIKNCRYVWSPQGEMGNYLVDVQKSFHLWNYRFAFHWYSSGLYEEPLNTAEENWAVAPGPQAPSEPESAPTELPHTPDYYYNCPEDGGPRPDLCAIAVAYTCRYDINFQRHCGLQSPTYARHSQIYINHTNFAGAGTPRTAVLAHEMGHSLGLAKHEHPACLMHPTTTLPGPSSCDIGVADPISSPMVAPCGGSSSQYGIRCIYWWWREQGQEPPDDDCYDVNRDGVVDLTNDIFLAAEAFDSHAGEPRYHPDADINFDGTVDLVNDILGIASQFDDVCEEDHYPFS